MQYVIFGASGYIGSYLYQRLKEEGKKVLGTKSSGVGSSFISFDILTDSVLTVTSQVKDDKKTAIVCIARPNINDCYENYDDAYAINVTKTKELIQTLTEMGYYVIFFSTDNVFDGKKGNYTEEDETNAINKYGMMKAEMEKFLSASEPEVCIFRISKAVGTGTETKNILSELDEMARGGIVRCIKGNRLSFTAMEDIYQACLIASREKLRGIYNIAGDEAFSRAELAGKFFCRMKNDSVSIIECGLEEFNLNDGRPLDISMSNLKFKQKTGYQFISMDTVIDRYMKNRNKI